MATAKKKTTAKKEQVHLLRPNGEPRVMPTDYTISLGAKGGTDRLLVNPGSERVQSMRGFEETYVDIIDYIVRITHRIWEEKDIGYIYDTYAHNSRVVDGFGLQYGRDKIVADTVHTINAFPNIRLFADEIVWAGDDEMGFHTSHRTVIKGTNTGMSRFGLPTGRPIELWVIANCVALDNEIFEEWVLYDNADMVRQLGFDLREMARKFGNLRLGSELPPTTFEPERLPGQGKPVLRVYEPGQSLDVADFLETAYHNALNRRMLQSLYDSHAANVRVLSSNGRRLYGRAQFQAFLLSLLATFPDLAFQIDDLYWMGNDDEGYRTAMRWSIVGKHDGWGIYGAPTGRPVQMWGITQHEIKDGRITQEWFMFNEFAVMQQIFHD
ncbi:ester cyclase [Candidatus Leptofilum sp.]|uniref:nuclear transport factor 2 family protein n=1 Tax=Candidatus Leptofilum sp. TaxID=3241576 RepID=UPI003B5B9059